MDGKTKIHKAAIIGAIALFAALGRYILVERGMQPFPNFEVITVAAFLVSMLLESHLALAVSTAAFLCSDLLLGNSVNSLQIFTYSGLAMVSLISAIGRNRISRLASRALGSGAIKTAFIFGGLGVSFTLLYDIWTNFGWWIITPMYPHTAAGLLQCYAMGVPFMIYHALSGAITFTLIGAPAFYYIIQKRRMSVPRESVLSKSVAVAMASILVVMPFAGCIGVGNTPRASEPTDVKMRIIGDGWVIEYNASTTNSTAYLFLLECASGKNITVKSTYYGAYDSTLVDEINGSANGEEGKYWQYYVLEDGVWVLPMVGCDKYILKDGDSIEWRFEVMVW